MVEVIHEHETNANGGNNFSALIGIILVVVVILFLFYYFGRGLLGGGAGQTGVNIPNHVDVNINQKPAK
jgi:hypothetical protein